MEYRILPHGGEKIGVIGMGSSVIGAQPEEEITATVRAAVDSGVNYFDMAGGHAAIFAAYGKALEGIRDKVYLQIHFGADYTSGEYGWTTELAEVKRSVAWQLEQLRTNYIDVGFIHCLDEESDLAAYQEDGVLDYVLALKKQGVIRHIGLSSHTPALVEQKMSMLYLKSQVNPHFLYNTLDAIRIQAQLDGDKKVADLLMRLVDFFRRSVKVNQPEVPLEDELELLEAYLDLMCYRYPELNCRCEVEPELYDALVPNFILQPLVENSLLHSLKNKGYRGQVTISARRLPQERMEITIYDTGSGFGPGKKAEIDQMLLHYDRQPSKLEGNSIGVLNVQKRVKLLCGQDYGLSYRENETGGVTACLLLPIKEEP